MKPQIVTLKWPVQPPGPGAGPLEGPGPKAAIKSPGPIVLPNWIP